MLQGAAVQEIAGAVVGGHRGHVGADQEKILEKLPAELVVPAGFLQGILHQREQAVHVRDVAGHGVAHLLHRLAGGGLRRAHQGLLVGVEEEHHGEDHHAQHHAGDDQHQHAAHAQPFEPLHVPLLPSLRRSPTGETPKYFLKQ